ncbi:DDE-domain-containing protein [Zopfia rhizophila CBS 207.26]|uniref:DDE-domain-containing protein n=1 Tax=Zopfia rhizophila CBS 207.26 TaxID=1314779 RepID=A0A6A6ECX7_9PEZI|nr:DDE-domain-containing protein [Zopfia rhizophila CBS 207.26]
MPAHSSHILQPLDVGCFSPLKTAYGRQVEKLMRNRFNHITKLEFLPAFRDAFNASITEKVTWQSKTPKNYHEFGSQTKLITNKLGSSLSSLKDGSKKGCGKARADRAELTQRRCGNCSGTRHNAQTCEINKESTIESSSDKNGTVTNSTVK